MSKTREQYCDLVMEGGGVKGIGLVGALSELAKHKYAVRRVAGTSAGAIVGALVAAGASAKELQQIMTELDYRRFRDEDFIDSLGLPGKAVSLVFEKGIYEGEFLRRWLGDRLRELGVETFADLKLTEPWAKDLPPEQRYKLLVITSDVTRGRLVRLPWDYHVYGLDPGKQRVADAVRSSMSIPFFYEPAHLGKSLLVDGGILSNFPIDLFESTPDWPTFGIKLSARPEANLKTDPAEGIVSFTEAIFKTMVNAHDQMHLDDPCTQRRTMFVDVMDIKSTDFDITRPQQEALFKNGIHAGQKFFANWDFAKYKAECLHDPKH